MEEKRKFPRFDSTFQVKYSLNGQEKQSSYTLSENISKGGLRMPAMSGIVNEGNTVKLDIKLDNRKWHVMATGKVIWIKPLKRKAVLNEEMGIQFINANPDDIDNLIRTKSITNRLPADSLA